MSKILKKIAIIMLLIIMLSTILTKAASLSDWNNYFNTNVGTNRNKIIGKDGTTYTLSDGAKVPVIQYADEGHTNGSNYISILAQPHVYCVQKRKKFRFSNLCSWFRIYCYR